MKRVGLHTQRSKNRTLLMGKSEITTGNHQDTDYTHTYIHTITKRAIYLHRIILKNNSEEITASYRHKKITAQTARGRRVTTNLEMNMKVQHRTGDRGRITEHAVTLQATKCHKVEAFWANENMFTA